MRKTGHKNINTKEYWDRRYEDRAGYERETGLTRFNTAVMEIINGQKVVDIGCGIGTLTEMIKSVHPDCEVWGTDISAQAIKDNDIKNPHITYHVQTVGHQDALPDNYFDFVFSGEVLEHLDDPTQLFKDAYRVLKPGGKFMVTTPNEDNIRSPEHTFTFNRDDITLMFETSGFEDVRHVMLPNGQHLLVIVAVGRRPL